MNILAKNLLFYRQLNNWSQQELAERARVRQSIVCKIEKGDNTPRIDTLQSIAIALGVTVDTLLDQEKPT